MKKLIAFMLALCLTTAGFASVAAQDVETSYASNTETPVTWSDDRGNILATMQVMNVNPDWMDYADGAGPDRGIVYQAVTISVTNVSGEELEIRAGDFSLVDGYGRWIYSSTPSVAEDVSYELFHGGATLAADETSEFILVYELPMDIPTALLVWEPDSRQVAMVNLAQVELPDGAVATGLNTPSTWTDDRGNVIATFQVTGVNLDWLDYSENHAPDRGSVYHAVNFTVTNESDDVVVVNPSHLTMVDSSGANIGISRPDVAEDSGQEVFIEGVELAPGESVDGMLVYLNFAGLEPTAMLWQPDNGLVNVVVLQDDGSPIDSEATPVDSEATPVG